MKKIIIFLNFLLVVFCFLPKITFAVEYNYPYVCNTEYCYSTKLDGLNPNSTGYYLSDVKINEKGDFSNYVYSLLKSQANYYSNNKITLNLFYGDAFHEKSVYLMDILDYNSVFYEGEDKIEYNDGIDYILSNYTQIINELNYGMPYGMKKSNLYDLDSNILKFENKNLYVKNYCTSSSCLESKYVTISYKDNYNVYLLSGTKKLNSTFNSNVFVISNDSYVSGSTKAGDTLDFRVGFEDYLDVSKSETKYNFEIGFDNKDILTGNETSTVFFTGSIIVNNSTYSISSPGLVGNIQDIIKLSVIDGTTKHIKITIAQSPIMMNAGYVKFFMKVKNLNTYQSINDASVTSYRIISPGDDLGDTSKFTFRDYVFGEKLNKGTTIRVDMNLFDKYGNKHYDNIEGYTITPISGSSEYIELADTSNGSPVFSSKITGYKVANGENISFLMKFSEGGYHDFLGFNVRFKQKLNSSTYSLPITYSAINLDPPLSMYSNTVLQKIKVEGAGSSDYTFECSNESKTIYAKCITDNSSGCNPAKNTSVTFNSEGDNGKSGNLTIQDYAYNTKSFLYTFNHIDKIAPSIEIYKNNTLLNNGSYLYKANSDDLKFILKEKTTTSCIYQLNYTLKINGTVVKTASSSSEVYYTLPTKFFETVGVKVLSVTTTDKYGNIATKSITFHIYPDNINVLKSTITVNDLGTKYANNSEYYNYTLVLKDKYGNLITGKTIDNINQSCENITGCETIKTNMTNNTGDDGLLESGYSSSDLNGKVIFFLKSLVPGEFSNYFDIKIKEWSDLNVQDGIINTYSIGNSFKNSFKKPLLGILEVSKNGTTWGGKPEIGTNMFYKLNINNGSGPNISNIISSIKINDFRSFIQSHDTNTVIQNISTITELETLFPKFSARINNLNINSLGNPGLKILKDTVEISYLIGGKQVNYYLGSNNSINGFDISIFNNGSGSEVFTGIKTNGIIQGSGNQKITGQVENYTNIKKFDSQTKVRTNAYNYIKSMKSGDIINGVKYVVGDIKISGDLDYETLVVKNGNIIIEGNLNPGNKNLGLIVLKDGYNLTKDFSTSGNIYINSDVTSINALFYTDGGVMSSNTEGKLYINDSDSRTSDLQKQLVINGSLFTKNTIGGAILNGSNYLLPGNKISTDFDNAMIFDLNYLRRGNEGCDKNTSGECINKEATYIKYAPNNNPKLFK